MTVQKHGQNMMLQNSDVDDVASSVRGVLRGRQGRLREMTIFQFLLDTQFRNFCVLIQFVSDYFMYEFELDMFCH